MSENVTVNVDTTELKSKAEAIAEICAERNVFYIHQNSPIERQFEKESFVNNIVRHAETFPKHYLELTYRNSLVRFIIQVIIVNGVAKLHSIGAYDHPYESETMDYTALNAAIKAV